MSYFKIKCCITGAVRFEGKFDSLRPCVEAAVKARVDLSRVDLSGANLSGANLSGANLSGANLYGANLSGANLYGANLSDAILYDANLSRTNLYGANLSSALVRNAKIGKRGLMKEATRSDGYRFMLFDCEDGAARVMAGCRWFTLPEAWEHWTRTRNNTLLGEETFDILVLFEHYIERITSVRLDMRKELMR